MQCATANGTATAGSDYTAASGTADHRRRRDQHGPITVAVTGDTALEAERDLHRQPLPRRSTPPSPTPAALGTITNDDAAPTLAIGDVTVAEGNSGTTAFTFTVTLSQAQRRSR